MEHCHIIAFYTEQYQIIELNTEHGIWKTEYPNKIQSHLIQRKLFVYHARVSNMLRRIQHYPSVFMYDYVCTVQVCMYIVQYSKVENITVDQEYFKS